MTRPQEIAVRSQPQRPIPESDSSARTENSLSKNRSSSVGHSSLTCAGGDLSKEVFGPVFDLVVSTASFFLLLIAQIPLTRQFLDSRCHTHVYELGSFISIEFTASYSSSSSSFLLGHPSFLPLPSLIPLLLGPVDPWERNFLPPSFPASFLSLPYAYTRLSPILIFHISWLWKHSTA